MTELLDVHGAPPAWLTDPRAEAVMAALDAAGGEGSARFVGGCVRNTLTGHPIDDIDIASRLEPPAVMAALGAAGLRWVPTGVEHGTVTAISGGKPFEITTLRRDVTTDGRNATVAFTTDWAQDAQRRDFRLNALYADRAGRLYDPTGQGADDARAGRIVFVGDAAARVREDYLRILRFFRFFAWYGRGAPDAAAVDACAALKDGMVRLAAERISKELLKLLAAPDPRAAVALMARTGVLAQVLPGADDLARFERLVAVEAEDDAAPDAVLRLAALLAPGEAKPAAARLRLSNAQRDRLIAAEGGDPALGADMGAAAGRAAIYRLGAATFADRVRLARAAGDAAAAGWTGLLALARDWRAPVLPVNGADAAAAGASPGPPVGAALRAVESWWIAADFAPTRDETLARLRTVIAELNG